MYKEVIDLLVEENGEWKELDPPQTWHFSFQAMKRALVLEMQYKVKGYKTKISKPSNADPGNPYPLNKIVVYVREDEIFPWREYLVLEGLELKNFFEACRTEKECLDKGLKVKVKFKSFIKKPVSSSPWENMQNSL